MRSPANRTWGEVQRQVTSLTGSKVLSVNETGIVYIDTTLGAVTVTLPPANLCTGLGFYFRIQAGVANFIIAPAGIDRIDRITGSISCGADNASVCIYSDGQGWFRCNIGTWA